MSGLAQKNFESGNFIGDCYTARVCIINRGYAETHGTSRFIKHVYMAGSATICNGLTVDTITGKGPANCITMLSELKVDIINENGAGMGVIIEGVVIKDGAISVPVTLRSRFSAALV